MAELVYQSPVPATTKLIVPEFVRESVHVALQAALERFVQNVPFGSSIYNIANAILPLKFAQDRDRDKLFEVVEEVAEEVGTGATISVFTSPEKQEVHEKSARPLGFHQVTIVVEDPAFSAVEETGDFPPIKSEGNLDGNEASIQSRLLIPAAAEPTDVQVPDETTRSPSAPSSPRSKAKESSKSGSKGSHGKHRQRGSLRHRSHNRSVKRLSLIISSETDALKLGEEPLNRLSPVLQKNSKERKPIPTEWPPPGCTSPKNKPAAPSTPRPSSGRDYISDSDGTGLSEDDSSRRSTVFSVDPSILLAMDEDADGGKGESTFLNGDQVVRCESESAVEGTLKPRVKSAEERRKDMLRIRECVIDEIVRTERTYVAQLEALLEIYVAPLEESKILAPHEMCILFSNIGSISMFHGEHFLPALQDAATSPNDNSESIGAVFIAHSPYFKLYSTYYNDFDGAVAFLTNLGMYIRSSSRRRKFKTFMKEARSNVKHAQQSSFDGFLVLPVQRLPRYKLLLEQLVKHTPCDHKDYEVMLRALDEIKHRVEECNERKRAWEVRQKGVKILKRLFSRSRHERSYLFGAPTQTGANGQCQLRAFIQEGTLRVIKTVSHGIPSALLQREQQDEDGSTWGTWSASGSENTASSSPTSSSSVTMEIVRESLLCQDFAFFLFTGMLVQCRVVKSENDATGATREEGQSAHSTAKGTATPATRFSTDKIGDLELVHVFNLHKAVGPPAVLVSEADMRARADAGICGRGSTCTTAQHNNRMSMIAGTSASASPPSPPPLSGRATWHGRRLSWLSAVPPILTGTTQVSEMAIELQDLALNADQETSESCRTAAVDTEYEMEYDHEPAAASIRTTSPVKSTLGRQHPPGDENTQKGTGRNVEKAMRESDYDERDGEGRDVMVLRIQDGCQEIYVTCEDEESLAEWRDKICEAAAKVGGVGVKREGMVPELWRG
ncbi:hypothetical protein HK102_007559 [Quaeritorhiza haematococci]|nr:hypothetical protein HK102_007559 [Quaeritorhiza haematococci]